MVTKWVVAIFCQSRHFDFVLISVYAPPRKPMQHTLGLVEEMLARSSSANVVVAGDFNAKHRAWGPRAGDDRGARVMELAAAAGLMVLNDPLSPPTYENTYASSWIDVTLATPAVVAAGYVWQVSDNVTFSEHKYVTVRVGSREVAPRKRLTRYAQAELLTALSRETWFGRVVGSRLGTPEALESVLGAFYRMLNGYMDRYRRPVRTGRAGNSWWTPELANERKRLNAMRRRYQRARDDSMRSVWRHEYSAALARFRRSIREARDEFERECRSACSRGNVYSKTFREAFGRTRPPRLLPPLERPDGTYTTTHLESAALLLRSQIAVDDAREDLPEHAAVRSLAEEPYGPDNDDVPFTEAEVRAVLAGMPSRSSPGPDEITPRLMRGLFDAHTTFVMHVFNSALRLGHFPRCWRRGRIIFLPKPDRPPQRTTSYRPICVNSIFGKVLERLLNGRLYHFMWRNGHVHANQFGFTHGRSAVSALVRLKERLAELKAARTPAVMMALDFQGAFDSVWHPGVLRFFRERRVPANLYHLLRTFLRDRSVVFISHAGEIEAHPSLGSPQGSPLSPMLWNVTIHDLLDLPLPTGITLQAYADDTVIVVPAQNRDALAELGSRVLGQVIG